MNARDPSHDDELVSAYLDGEATPEEAAVVEGDPALRVRLEQLRGAAEAVGGPVPPPAPSTEDAAIARALAELDETDETAPVAPPVPMPHRRPGLRRAWLAPVAAVVLALAVAVPLLAGGDGDRDQTTAASDDSAEHGEASQGAGGGGSGLESAPQSTTTLVPRDLGRVSTRSELRRRLQGSAEQFASGSQSPPLAADSTKGSAGALTKSESCDAVLRQADPELGTVTDRAVVTYRGTPAVVFGFQVDDGTRIVAAATDDCRQLVAFDL
jgi:hypothetical protein